MKKLKNSKGFTLMEMLIVVAIIAILIAIAIPSFTSQLEKARESADIANIRSAYAEAMAKHLTGDDSGATTEKMTQTKTDWQYYTADAVPDYLGTLPTDVVKDNTYKITITEDDDGTHVTYEKQ